jgi:hypothetical protein
MSKPFAAAVACALALGIGALHAVAQTSSQPAYQFAPGDDDWTLDVTVVAIAPDGTWGTATEPHTGPAIARAIDECRAKYTHAIGCGYRSVIIRRGWSLLFRCGTENVLAAGRALSDAHQAALRQETALRAQVRPDLPSCVRTLTVDPEGRAVIADQAPAL